MYFGNVVLRKLETPSDRKDSRRWDAGDQTAYFRPLALPAWNEGCGWTQELISVRISDDRLDRSGHRELLIV